MSRENKKEQSIVLIGFMGSGKTSVGRSLSDLLRVPVLDTDELIALRERRTIKEIFERCGEEYFRSAETDLIRGLPGQRKERFVLSVGGGLPLREENRPLLRQIGIVVYLKTGVPELCRRLKGDRERPLLQGEGTLEEKISRILRQREPLYEDAADRVVVTDALSVREVAEKIAEF